MSGKAWVLKGIDADQRQQIRAEAAKEGLSVAEYLSRALQRRMQESEDAPETIDAQFEPADAPSADDERPSTRHRLDGMERRIEMAVAGLDDALRSIDNSLYQLADRFDETEMLSQDTAQAVSNALSDFNANLQALQAAHEMESADAEERRAALQAQIARAEEIAISAESAAASLKEAQDALAAKFESEFAEQAQSAQSQISSGLSDARAAAEAAAQSVEDALAEALAKMRQQREFLESRISATEAATAEQLASAEEEAGARHAALETRVDGAEQRLDILARGLGAAFNARIDETDRKLDNSVRNLGQMMHRAEGVHSAAIDQVADDLRAAKAHLAREIAAGDAELRSAQDANDAAMRNAIAAWHAELEQQFAAAQDALRADFSVATDELNERQIGASARIKLLDEAMGGAGELLSESDGASVRTRLARMEDVLGLQAETDARLANALDALEQGLNALADRPVSNLDESVLARFDGLAARLRLQEGQAADVAARTESLEQSLDALGMRIAEFATQAGSSIKALDASVADLMRRSSAAAVLADVEAVAERLEQRMAALEHSTVSLLEDERRAFAGWIEEARSSFASNSIGESVQAVDQRIGELASATATFDRRFGALDQQLTALDAKQAQISGAIAEEIGRMGHALNERLDTALTNAQTPEGVATREELSRLIASFDSRFDDFERREQETSARLGEDIGAVRQRLDERFAQIERRSVLAIEKIAESVALLGKKLSQRQEEFVLDLVERVESADPRLAHKLSQKR